MKKKLYLLVLFALGVCGLHAQYVAPSEGIFRIINVAYNAALMENYENNNLRCTSTIGDADDFDQLWILKKEGNGYSIQNAYTGAYIQTGNTGTEVPYWTGTTPKTFNIKAGGSKKGYNIFDSTLNGQGLHSKGANGNVVRWVDCEPSEWKFAAVEVSKEAMTLAQAEYAEYLRAKLEFESTCAELIANKDKFEKALAKYFENAACTILKDDFVSVSEEDLRAAMTADNLPTELIDMAVKVKADDWAEDNEKADKPGWNSYYAKKFRVQMIEPHSIAGEITEWIGHQGHTNMDNPTGLYGNNRQVLYIMVEGEIKEGAELYATWLVGHTKMPNYNNGYGESGIRLKKGLNIVPIRTDGSALYFNYLVHTFNKDTWQFAHKLSDYDDLKIHVAGGYINGYYNVEGDALYVGDNDDDWVYYEERANLENITILGRYEVLQFELNDIVNYTDDKGSTWSEKGLAYYFPEELPASMPNSPAFTAPNQRINGIIEAWDRIFLSEKMTLGVASKADVDSMNKLFPRYDATWTDKAEIYNYDDALYAFCDSIKDRDGDYGEYYNHRGVAFGTRTGYMYGSWDHSGYHINTTHSILTCIATEAGPTWGPAHEIGHQHQALYTLNGEMEVTNNTFANVAAWYMGMGTSRVNGTEGNLAHAYDNFKNGGYLLSNNIWVLTQRYYRLWLYYHRAGNNTQFFPRLFELLRKNPMERSYGSSNEMRPNDKGVMENVGFQLTNGYRSYLHFYKLCCEAAQEDLTEFFRAYGCFVPVDGVFQGDYTNSKYYTTQEEIDKAIAEVKAKNYPVNNKVLFINDCTTDITYGHDGKTQRSFWDGETGRNLNAEVGNYIDYLAKDSISGKYLYTLSDLNISIAGGDGALGFAIYNKDNEILAFSNNHKFSINEDVLNLLRDGNATLVAVSANGDDVRILSKAEGGDEKEQLEALKKSLTAAKTLLGYADETSTRVGYYKYSYLTELQALVDAAQEAYDNKDTSINGYGTWAILLDEAVAYLETNSSAKVPIYESSYYALGSLRYNNTALERTSSGLKVSTSRTPAEDADVHWMFVPTGVENQYYLQHIESGMYISTLPDNARAKAEATATSKAIAFNIIETAEGKFLVQNSDAPQIYLACDASKNVIGSKDMSNTTSQWSITLVADNHSAAIKGQLETLLSMVSNTITELIAATEPELQLHSDITVLDEQLPLYIAELLEANDSAIKGINEGYAFLDDLYTTLKAAYDKVKVAYRKALALPEATTDSEVMAYYIQHIETETYVQTFEGAGRYKGALRTSELTDAADHNFWFYLRPGAAEGEYYIYNWKTGKAIGTNSNDYIYANGTVDPTSYKITIAEDAYGFIISTADGNWTNSSNGYVQSKSTSAMWNLVSIGKFNTNGIETITPAATNNIYYDLLGRPVENPTTGIYILNGRKVIVK